MDNQPSDDQPPKIPKQIPDRVRAKLEKAEVKQCRLQDGCWTPSLIPGESHRDILRDLASGGFPDLVGAAQLELEAWLQNGRSISELFQYSREVMEGIERRIDLEARLQETTVDPFGRAPEGVAMVVAAIKAMNPEAAAVMASQMETWIRAGNAEAVAAIANMTKCDPGQEHRVHRMLKLVLEFHNEHQRFPSSAEARRAVADREIAEARNPKLDRWALLFPDQRDAKEWKRLWEQCGLEWLEKGKPGRPRKK